jgi:hypothetical protein
LLVPHGEAVGKTGAMLTLSRSILDVADKPAGAHTVQLDLCDLCAEELRNDINVRALTRREYFERLKT